MLVRSHEREREEVGRVKEPHLPVRRQLKLQIAHPRASEEGRPPTQVHHCAIGSSPIHLSSQGRAGGGGEGNPQTVSRSAEAQQSFGPGMEAHMEPRMELRMEPRPS